MPVTCQRAEGVRLKLEQNGSGLLQASSHPRQQMIQRSRGGLGEVVLVAHRFPGIEGDVAVVLEMESAIEVVPGLVLQEALNVFTTSLFRPEAHQADVGGPQHEQRFVVTLPRSLPKPLDD